MSYTIKKLGPYTSESYKSDIDSEIYMTIDYSAESESGIYLRIKANVETTLMVKYGEFSNTYNSIVSELESQHSAALAELNSNSSTNTSSSELLTDFSGLALFDDDSIVTEEAQGVKIDETTGLWSSEEVLDATEYMKKLATFENSLSMFKRVMSGNISIQEAKDAMTLVNDKDVSFDENGVALKTKFVCPECGKEVDLLLKNGYCSKSCAAKARIKKALSSIDDGALRVLDFIQKIRDKLSLLDMILNVVTTLPDLIKGIAKLPSEYRDYVMLRIDLAFLEIKRCINIVLIEKNNMLIEILKKLKVGTLDSKLQVLFTPIRSIIEVVTSVQLALNIALAVIMKLLDVPLTGIPPQSYGWLMTAKSAQYAETSGKLFIEIVPKVDLFMKSIGGLPNRLNNINQQAIDAITKVSLPPILEFEFFEPPAAFKVRYALSLDNTPRLKKLLEMLEMLVVISCDTFPRYSRLKLTNIWYVLSILTGWGPLSRGVYGDFIFHGAM